MLRVTLPLAAALLAVFGPAAHAQTPRAMAEMRDRMIQEEIISAGVTNERVIEAIRNTPRHEFVPVAQREYAYFDMALPIGEGQTISPPFVVAYMTEQLDPQPEDVVLEIGTGSGYQAAVLSPLVKEVYSIEIVEPLGKRAAAVLKKLKYANVFTRIGDGYQGWPEHAPFDKIIVTCSPEDVPQALIDQLKEGGRMIVPIGERYHQSLYLYRKENGELVSEALIPTLFVPMTGEAEEERQVLPDPENPRVTNGGFEELVGEDAMPTGWHYVRQMTVERDADAPDGEVFVTFTNSDRGRDARALQAFAVDGRKVREIEVALWIRGEKVRQGATQEDRAAIAITFYDENRKAGEQRSLGGWRGTFDWQQERTRFVVPVEAREAILRIGLLGGMGTISFDGVEIEVAERRP